MLIYFWLSYLMQILNNETEIKSYIKVSTNFDKKYQKNSVKSSGDKLKVKEMGQ